MTPTGPSTQPLAADWPLRVGMTSGDAAVALGVGPEVPRTFVGSLAGGVSDCQSPLYPGKVVFTYWDNTARGLILTGWAKSDR